MKINQILDKIDDYQLFVPAFQREFVWKREDAKRLIKSMLNDYPTGTMLTWETNNPPELKGSYTYNHDKGTVKLILDGQQRITTLYLLMRGKVPPYYTKQEIINDITGLYINVLSLDLEYYKKILMSENPFWVDITKIFRNEVNALQVIKKASEKGEISQEDQFRILENINKIQQIQNKDFLEQTIPVRANIREAIDIFYIVNASGVNLTDAELALAQISGYWPEARERIKKKMFELESEGWAFKLDFFIYVLLACLYQMGSKLEKLHDIENMEPIKKAWEKLENHTLDYVFNILRTHAFIDHTKEINSVYALIPIILYTYQKDTGSLSEIEIKKIIKWFYYSQIRNRYISQLQQKLDKDLGIVSKENNPFDKLLNIIEADRRLEIHPDEFIGVGVLNPLWSLMKWYFKSQNAVCLTTGISIKGNPMGKKYSLEWDHIFPFSILKKNGYDWNNRYRYSLAQEITNRAVLTQVANRTKSNKNASDYLIEIKSKYPKALKLQSIPTDEKLWMLDRYEDFLIERRKLLAKNLNNFLEKITDTTEEPIGMNVEDLILQGENSSLELKTTLRWDIKQDKVNKKLEEVILKTIGAFSNAEGGTLIIGVQDDLIIKGLHYDYSSLNGDKDKFEIHLRNLLNKEYGVEFVTNYLTISFPEIEDKEICLIDIKAGVKPLYTTIRDNNGVISKKFYVRSGNSSQEIPINEIHDYLSKRF